MTEVSSIMAKICNINFWIENDPPPPPLELFRKFIRFGRGMRPLLETAMERRGGPGGCIAQFLVTLVALDPTHVSQWPTVNG